MALADVVLGLVCAGPAHGYALHARLVRLLGRDGGLERAHVYAALHGLARAGLVTARDAPPAAARALRQHAATPAGAAALRAWLARPARDARSVLRRPLLAKVAVLGLLGEAPSRRALTAERARRGRVLDAAPARPDDDALTRLLRARARRHAEVERWLIDRLDESAAPAAGPAAATARWPASRSR